MNYDDEELQKLGVSWMVIERVKQDALVAKGIMCTLIDEQSRSIAAVGKNIGEAIDNALALKEALGRKAR